MTDIWPYFRLCPTRGGTRLSLEGKHLDRRLRMLAVVPYPTLGASPRLRVEQYVPFLRADGIDVTVSPFFDDAAFRTLYLPGHFVAKAFAVIRGAMRRTWDALRAGRYDV